ncbi:HEAT repeat domain-containing protein [Mesotoga sp. B105.6.4]|uniref:HEAT repeat domain-containing protein n=1 Tax=Mesotoga sp. B105.6.4 TaxID=1582224 RepID=UPI000CCBF7C8|nr:HEAT repeat domain-containing protein [Mesotoga sp. B105.6.4]PNS39265.1 HEAT domain containing protein [Mesotoga sp. B105.6.4]
MNPKDIRKMLQAIEEEILSRTEMDVKEMLDSPSAYVRARAVKSAADREMRIENIESFLEDPSPEVRKNAVVTMAKLSENRDSILKALDDPSDLVRSITAKELVEFGYEDEDLARRIAADPSKKVRKTFVVALAEAGENELLKEFDEDPSNDIRSILAACKGQLRLEEEELSSLSGKFQKVALLSRLGQRNSGAAEELLVLLKDFRSSKVKQIIVETFESFPDDIALPTLKKLIDSDDRTVAISAMKTHRKIKGYDVSMLQSAERFMDSEDEEMRFAGAQYIKGLLEPSAAEILHTGLEDPSDRVRAVCMEALASLMDHSIADVIDESLRSTSSRLKKASLRAVKKLKTIDIEDHITRILSNRKEDLQTRVLASSVTGLLKLEGPLPHLEEIALNTSIESRLRISAVRAMARINPSRLAELFGFTV